MKRSLALLAAGAAIHTATVATPVGPALDRPALAVREPARVVLMAAARSGQRIAAVGERGVIALSDDGGATWRQANVPVSVSLTAVRFVDAQTAYAVGHGGVVLASTDGGLTWERRLDGRKVAQLALAAAQAAGDARSVKEAERLLADGPDKPFFDLHFFDGRRGVVIGAYGLIFATEDGGRTWQPWMQRLDNPKALHLYALRVRGDAIVIAGEQGLLLRSDDGGATFRRLNSPYKGSYFTLELPSPKAIVIAGLRGNAWRSDDGGVSWARANVPVVASFTASSVIAGGEILLANQAGLLFAMPAATGDLKRLPLPPLQPVNALLPLDNGALLTVGPQGARRAEMNPGTKP